MKRYSRRPIRDPDRDLMTSVIERCRSTCIQQIIAFSQNDPVSRAFLAAFAVLLAGIFVILSPIAGARAQEGIMSSGDLAVTGFSGTRDLGGQTFIDTDGVSLKVLGTSGKGSASAQVINAPEKFQAFARDIGQVFGVALDNAPSPNIYATSTSVLGLQIVTPDSDGDGVPERVNTGQAGASFMDGQFGTALGGGPGTVWRIDGTTGQISVFADIAFDGAANSGPGLGNIAFDPAHYQFYVSDLDTGMIHRLDLSGNDLGTFDHGVEGRSAAGLPAVVMNPANRMDITSAAFDATNAATWGLTDEQRRVWGLTYYKGRLYYAVVGGSQIWSVGINADGSFAADARVEIQSVPDGHPVSDILFTPQGRMVLAQRGGIQGSHDYSTYHQPKQNRVLRYQRDLDGNWIQEPDEYAIGFPTDHRNASGGVGLACDGTLWSTGDALRNDPALAAQLSAGGPLVVHGLQGNNQSLIRPFNVPPWSSWFIDYQGQPANETDAGHVGDVEVYRKCSGGRAESYPGWYPVPEWYPPEGWVPPVWWPKTPDLEIEKFADKCIEDPAAVGSLLCSYTIVTTNVGAADFVGHLNVTDNPPATAVFVPPAGGSIPWTCAQPGGAGTPIDCQSDNVETLHPGESETLDITIQVTPAATDKYIKNCAILVGDDPHDFGLNEDCDEVELPRPDLETRKHFWGCQPEGANQRCFFILEFENVGGAQYTGPLHFVENIPAGTIFGAIHLSTTAGWACVGGPPIECTLPNPPGVTMNPGDVEQLLISVIVPAAVHGDMENCVELGQPTHADDPEAPGVNKACAPFTIAAPFVPKCPIGWQPVPPAGAPANWQVIAIGGVAPDGTPWGLTCMRPEPKKELPIGQPVPQPKPPVCKPGEVKFTLPHQVPQGWSKRKVTNGLFTIWCAVPPIKTPPVVHKCPAGWTKVPPQGAPATHQVIIIDGVNPDGSKWGIKCMRPKPHQPQPQCKQGETKFFNLQQVPKGWKIRTVFDAQSKKMFYCAKPAVVVPLPKCLPHEKKFSKVKDVPQGWSKRKVAIGPFKFWCAKPGFTIPLPTCGRGETKFASSKQVPSGWTKRKVTRGKTTIWCGKPGSIIPPKPKCVGGRLIMLKSMPPQWRCICPQGWNNIKGTCKKPPISSTPQVTPQPPVKPCPPRWNRVRGKCVPPKVGPTPKPCPKNWHRVNGKCQPKLILRKPPTRVVPKPQIVPPSRITPKPKPKVVPQTRVNPRLKVVPKQKLQQAPKAKPTTQIAPPKTLKRKKRTNPPVILQQTGQRRVVR
ncbi:MAG: hypothetical protein MPJ78_07295 [Hyphomicrobiaceae bacterium]|nr:hypothetical protein [Hyphomicrobiaceae bacterium]